MLPDLDKHIPSRPGFLPFMSFSGLQPWAVLMAQRAVDVEPGCVLVGLWGGSVLMERRAQDVDCWLMVGLWAVTALQAHSVPRMKIMMNYE